MNRWILPQNILSGIAAVVFVILIFYSSPVVSDSCGLKPERGPCTNYSVLYFYNSTANRCQRFWYGGCDGNDNRFNTEDECKEKCSGSRTENTGKYMLRSLPEKKKLKSCKWYIAECWLTVKNKKKWISSKLRKEKPEWKEVFQLVYYLMKKANLFSIFALRLVKVMYVFFIEILELDMQENISHWKEKRCFEILCRNVVNVFLW